MRRPAPPAASHVSQPAVACNLCGGSNVVPLYRPKRSPGPVVRCTDCGLVYVSPRERHDHIVAEARPLDVPADLRVSKDLRILDRRWEKPLIEDYLKEYPSKMANAHRMLAEIEQVVPKGRLLDFGTGPGLFLAAAKERGWQTYGLEPLVGFAIFARGYFGLEVTNDFLRDDTYPEGWFDVVTALQVVEHLTNPLEELRRLYRLVRKGGLLVIELPNIANIWVRILGARHRHFVEDHLYFFSPATLRQMLTTAGFQVVKEGYSTRTISLRSCLLQLARNLEAGQDAGLARAHNLVDHLPLDRASVKLNLGDIIYAFALKPRNEATG